MIQNAAAEKWLTKKRKKARFWQVKMFLNGLRLQFKETEPGTNNYSIYVPLFGFKFKFNDITDATDIGWKIFVLDEEKLEKSPEYFREEVMWYLVEKGYMAYIREAETGNNQRIFRMLLIDSGWGIKIIEKRIELCGKSPENMFMKIRMSEFLKAPMNKILSYCPGFFDYLM